MARTRAYEDKVREMARQHARDELRAVREAQEAQWLRGQAVARHQANVLRAREAEIEERLLARQERVEMDLLAHGSSPRYAAYGRPSSAQGGLGYHPRW